MSMQMEIATVDDDVIDRVRRDPALVMRIIMPDEPEAYLDERHRLNRGFLARMLGRRAGRGKASRDVPDLRRDDDITVDLDDWWHAVHYLLTGTEAEADPPLDFLLARGEPVAGIDTGFGPPRLFPSGDVVTIRDAMAEVTRDQLAERFDPEDMSAKTIYPPVWESEDTRELSDAILDAFESLKSCINEASGRGKGLVITMV